MTEHVSVSTYEPSSWPVTIAIGPKRELWLSWDEAEEVARQLSDRIWLHHNRTTEAP